MAQSKIWAILHKNRINTWLDNMIGNNSVVSEWKENFRLPQPTRPKPFLAAFCFSLSGQQTAC